MCVPSADGKQTEKQQQSENMTLGGSMVGGLGEAGAGSRKQI